jgi:heptosyltransferase-2
MPLRILVIGPNWVGDMVMAQSLFKLLRKRHPNVLLDVAAPAWTKPLIERMPEVNETIVLPFDHGEWKATTRWHLAQELKKHRYDQAIILPNSFKSALIPWLARIPKRTGYLGEYRYLVLNDIYYINKKNKRQTLMIEQVMKLGLKKEELLPPISSFYPSLSVSIQNQQSVLSRLQISSEKRRILAFAPGAAFGEAKCWGVENFANLAKHQIQAGWEIWLFGSDKDKIITDQIMTLTDHHCRNLAGQLSLPDTIDLLSFTTGVVTNDSGLLHIAAALSKPLVALYGPTSPDFTPPLSNNAHVLQLKLPCQPCFARVCPLKHHGCMRDLTPDRVLPIIAGWK